MSLRPSIMENGTHYTRHQGDTMTLISTTKSCKIVAMNLTPVITMLRYLSAISATSNILAGTMTTASKSPATAVNILLVAVTASLINTETSQPLTYIPNGNDRSPNSHRSKIACGNGNPPSSQRSSTFHVFKSRVSCCSGITKTITNVVPT